MVVQGRIIHIDFGFMLSNSPGGVNFERAPFKLTAEYMHIMDSDVDGRPSRWFNYFKARRLCCLSTLFFSSGLRRFRFGAFRFGVAYDGACMLSGGCWTLLVPNSS